MEQGRKISVIISIFSVAEYLPECVESVLNQTYPYKEIILVDDGSPDESPDICDQYARAYENVKVIHKANGGLSDARNKGLEYADGDYVLFLDGDDLWDDPEALTQLAERMAAVNADVLNFSYQKYNEATQEKISYFSAVPAMPTELKTKETQLNYLAEHHLYVSSAWNKLIKREVLTDRLLFEKGVYSEDVEWSAKLLMEARSMDFICADFYCYRQRSDSISHAINEKKCRDLCEHILACNKLLEEAGEAERTCLAYYTAYQYGTFFKVQAQAEKSPAECIERLSRYSGILSHHLGNRKLWCLHVGCKILGYRNLCRLIRFLERKK